MIIRLLTPVVILLGLALTGGSVVRAEIPNALEPFYSEAVISFNNKEFDKSLKLLDPLIQSNPEVLEFLELKALAFKATKNEAGTLEVYSQILDKGKAAGKSPKELAPYHFELGVIHFNNSRYKEATPHLVESARYSFNVAPARFFLGTIAFKGAKWAAAESNFAAVTVSDVDALRPAASFYLGQVALKTDSPSTAIQNFYDARKQSQDQLSDTRSSEETKKAAQQIFDATTQVLKPYENGQAFGGIALLSGYDSNVLSVPSDATSYFASGAGSIKETLQLGFGYATAPLNSVQIVPSYKGGFNYNLNSDTRSGEFMLHDLSVYMTKNPLARTSYGLKFQATHNSQAQVDYTTQKSSLQGYSLSGSVGPYFRHDLSKKLQFFGETYFQPQKYLQESTGYQDTNRSGRQFLTHVGLKNDNGNLFWNPGATLNVDINHTEGVEFRYNGFGITLTDNIRWSELTKTLVSLDYNHLSYPSRPTTARTDNVISIDFSTTYQWKKKISLLGDVQYTHNGSNITDSYLFNRTVISLGISYSIL